jgi:hypothetical protein
MCGGRIGTEHICGEVGEIRFDAAIEGWAAGEVAAAMVFPAQATARVDAADEERILGPRATFAIAAAVGIANRLANQQIVFQY